MALTVEYLIVGGGGGGGGVNAGYNIAAGGGGGGAVKSGSISVSGSQSVVVGGGGPEGLGASGGEGDGTNGGASSFAGITADGGGAGGGTAAEGNTNGHSGGCGGGGGAAGYGPQGAGGGATTGYAGGYGGPGGGNTADGGGGGGGMGGGGGGGTANGGTGTGVGGPGGPGVASAISGTTLYYGAGGGGGSDNGNAAGAAPGGSGVGGSGGRKSVPGGVAVASRGSGGGGSGSGAPYNRGGAGSAGVVILRYPGGALATGGTITSAGGYTIHTFTTNDTFTVGEPPTLTGTSHPVLMRGQTPGVNYSGTGMTPTGMTVNFPAGLTNAGGPYFGDTTYIGIYIAVAANAPLGPVQVSVSTPYGTSNTITQTIADVPTLTAINTYGNGPAAAFVGIKERIFLTGTNFVAGATVNASAGVTVSNVVITSSTRIDCDIVASVTGSPAMSVTTPGGTSAQVGLTIFDAIANSSVNPGMVINTLHGDLNNSHPGTLGMIFTMTQDRLVTHLGRWMHSGNAAKHTIMLRDSNYAELARAVVDMATSTVNQWNYVPLSTPVLLRAGYTYILSDMACVPGGDYWANISPVVMDGNANCNGMLVEVRAMTGFSAGAPRTDSYSLGFKFTATAGWYLTALGRRKLPGNNLAHRVVLKDASNNIIRSAIVDFTGGKGVDNQFSYATIPLFLMTAGASYYIMSDEQGGDAWYNLSTLTPWGGLTINGYAYEAYPATSGVVPVQDPTPNQMFVGVDVLTLVNSSAYAESYVTVNLKSIAAQQPMAMLI